jgi:hypothetical protein
MATWQELETREDVQAIIGELRKRPDLGACKLRAIDTVIGVVVVKKPSRGQASVMMTQIHDEEPQVVSQAMTGLFQTLIVYPPAPQLAELLDDLPLALTEKEAMRDFRVWLGNARDASAK